MASLSRSSTRNHLSKIRPHTQWQTNLRRKQGLLNNTRRDRSCNNKRTYFLSLLFLLGFIARKALLTPFNLFHFRSEIVRANYGSTNQIYFPLFYGEWAWMRSIDTPPCGLRAKFSTHCTDDPSFCSVWDHADGVLLCMTRRELIWLIFMRGKALSLSD